MITCKYFDYDFITENKLDLYSVTILNVIYSWIFSEKTPKIIIENKKKYFWISQSYISDLYAGTISQPTVSKKIKLLFEIGLIESITLKKGKYYCMNFNWNVVEKSLAKKEDYMGNSDDWFYRIHEYAQEQIELENGTYNKNEVTEMMLFEDENLPKEKIKKVNYDIHAYSIVSKVIIKSKTGNKDYFNHKFGAYREEQSKLFTKSCNYVQALYDGTFLNNRLYPLSEKFKTNQQFKFDLEQIKTVLSGIKGDWQKVKHLVFTAYENFVLMHEKEHVPCDKQYLVKSLNDWFYSFAFEEAGKWQSQFLQCLNKPDNTSQFYSEKKADNYFEKLSPFTQVGGNLLFELAPKGTFAGTFWENVKKLIDWGQQVWECDENAKYWMECEYEGKHKSGAKTLPYLFYLFCKEKNITVTSSTLDLEKAVSNNTPLVWFIDEAIKKHGLNPDLSSCANSSDLLDCYNMINDITFDDMDEIIF